MTPTTYYRDESVTLYTGTALETLRQLPDASVHCIVTSPPYWNLRNYGNSLQYGHEPTPEAYVDRLRQVFAELHRLLADDGTAWLNLGDCYSTGRTDQDSHTPAKNLLGLPWRTALALQHDGWLLRNGVVWHKRNAMPESVRDRLSTRYEMLFLLVKRPRYWFDLDAIREPLVRPEALDEGLVIGGSRKGSAGGIGATSRRRGHSIYGTTHTDTIEDQTPVRGDAMRPTGHRHTSSHPRGKNPGDVWSISTRPLPAAHFAAFPVDIPLRCIAAGCPPGGTVLDPFSGTSATGLAARQLGHPYIGIDLNPAYHTIALQRLGLPRIQAASNPSLG